MTAAGKVLDWELNAQSRNTDKKHSAQGWYNGAGATGQWWRDQERIWHGDPGITEEGQMQNNSRRVTSEYKWPANEIKDMLQPNSMTSKEEWTQLCKENGEHSGIPGPCNRFSSRIRWLFTAPSHRVVFFVDLGLCTSLILIMPMYNSSNLSWNDLQSYRVRIVVPFGGQLVVHRVQVKVGRNIHQWGTVW